MLDLAPVDMEEIGRSWGDNRDDAQSESDTTSDVGDAIHVATPLLKILQDVGNYI